MGTWGLIIIGAVGVGFICWQFKMLAKYSLHADTLTIQPQDKCIYVQGQQIAFSVIDFVTVREMPQPALLEKALSRPAYYAYMAQINFHLTDGTVVSAQLNSKAVLYHTLKQLEPFVRVSADITSYKPASIWVRLLWIIIIAGIVWFFKRA